MSFFKTTLLLGLMTGLLMVIGGLIGGRHGVVIFFVIAAVMNFFSYWFSDKIVLRAYGAQELDATLGARALFNRQRAGAFGGNPDAAALPDRLRHAQRVRDRPQRESCGRGRHARHHANLHARGVEGRHRA